MAKKRELIATDTNKRVVRRKTGGSSFTESADRRSMSKPATGDSHAETKVKSDQGDKGDRASKRKATKKKTASRKSAARKSTGTKSAKRR